MDRTSVERLLRKSLEDDRERGPISERRRQSQRSLEAYLKAGVRPRWMERQNDIERGKRRERERLARAYDAMRAAHGHDRAAFAARWREYAERQTFDEVNLLIRQHNEWYPIERDLPMDPRTGEYLKILGRSHVRPELGPAWVLELFPASPPGGGVDLSGSPPR